MRPTTIVLLVFLAFTLLASWWFSAFEKITREDYVGFSGEAVFNRYFAAESLLQEVGVDANSLAELSPNTWLPEPADTVLLSLDESLMVNGFVLDEWVRSGGHLVITAGGNPELLERYLGGALAARFVRTTRDDEPVEGDTDTADDEYDYYVDLDGTSHRIELVDPDTATATLSDERGLIVARMPRGFGIVTLVATEHYFVNDYLADHDHARLLLDIIVGYYDASKVWFIYNNSFESLWTYIWNNLPLTVTALLIAFLLWLKSILPRFGPPIRPAQPDRRSLMEHIAAAGSFEWKYADRDALADSTIDGLLTLAELRHPGIERLSRQQQAARLAAISGLAEQDIVDALGNLDGLNPRGFTRHMQTLQELRDRL